MIKNKKNKKESYLKDISKVGANRLVGVKVKHLKIYSSGVPFVCLGESMYKLGFCVSNLSRHQKKLKLK